MVLGQFAPINPRRLSELMHINPGTISVYVQRLVEKGPVQREQDADDRRNWWLSRTKMVPLTANLVHSSGHMEIPIDNNCDTKRDIIYISKASIGQIEHTRTRADTIPRSAHVPSRSSKDAD
jgi:hypothetical protein